VVAPGALAEPAVAKETDNELQDDKVAGPGGDENITDTGKPNDAQPEPAGARDADGKPDLKIVH
jgi:hypothetical protein